MNKNLIGKIDIKISGQGAMASILKLYPFIDEDTPVTTDLIISKLHESGVNVGYDPKLIQYYVSKVMREKIVLPDVIVAESKPAFKKNSNKLVLQNFKVDPHDEVQWNIYEDILNNFNLIADINPSLPFWFVKNGDILGKLVVVEEPINGTNIYGGEIQAGRFQSLEYFAGENVQYDSAKMTYIAGATGYVYMKETTLMLKTPYYLTPDKMCLYFMNLPRENEIKPGKDEIYNYCKKNNIDALYLKLDAKTTLNGHYLVAEGKLPGISTDAKLEILMSTDTKVDNVSEKGIIDYREIKKFNSVELNQVLAVKTLAVKGVDGEDLMGNKVPSKQPRDLIIKPGPGAKRIDTPKEMKIVSTTEGIVEYKHDTISVYPNVYIGGDVNYENGNITTKINVEIKGNVSTGFKVISEKNIMIGGTIEDNCYIESGGDIYVQGGVTGSNTKIVCGGNLTIKFIENATISCKGMLNVQRFILDADVECFDKIVIFGHGINLNERGAITGGEIKVKKTLMCPTVGNEVGVKSVIYFGHDRVLFTKIDNLQDTVNKLQESLTDMAAQYKETYNIDLNAANLYQTIKEFAKQVKDKIIGAIQEKQKIESKLKMMEEILSRELANKKQIILESYVEINKKIFPPSEFKCGGVQKTYESYQAPSHIYYDNDLKIIERTPYVSK